MRKYTRNLTLSALFLALGYALPFLTGQIPQFGSMLLPMHIPVFLCGLICGWQYGAVIGFILPLTRCLFFSMPPVYVAIAMAFELATYGFVAGFLYNRSRWQCVIALYRSIIIAMLAGRLVWGIAEIIIFGLQGNSFTWQAFMAGAFINAIPGIIVQLVLIPALMVALNKTGLIKFKRAPRQEPAATNE